MADEIEDTIEEIALSGVSSTSFSAGSSSQSNLSIAELIEADRYLAGKRAAALNHRGIVFLQIQPPGALNDS